VSSPDRVGRSDLTATPSPTGRAAQPESPTRGETCRPFAAAGPGVVDSPRSHRLAAAGAGWPRLAQIGRGWRRLAAAGAGWPRLAQVGRGWRRLAAAGAGWPRLAQAGRGWRRLAAVGAGWPRLAQTLGTLRERDWLCASHEPEGSLCDGAASSAPECAAPLRRSPCAHTARVARHSGRGSAQRVWLGTAGVARHSGRGSAQRVGRLCEDAAGCVSVPGRLCEARRAV